MKKEITKEQLEFITDDTCKYGHLLGVNEEGYYKCDDCHQVFEDKPPEGALISRT